jgi:hypothetical protein
MAIKPIGERLDQLTESIPSDAPVEQDNPFEPQPVAEPEMVAGPIGALKGILKGAALLTRFRLRPRRLVRRPLLPLPLRLRHRPRPLRRLPPSRRRLPPQLRALCRAHSARLSLPP